MDIFPFEKMRKYQDKFIEDLRILLSEGGVMFAEVPTGVGKTSAVLSASLERALEDNYRVLFLTPRHSQHMIVLETIKLINKKGFDIRASDIVGKKWLCNIDGIEFLSNTEFNDYCRIVRNEEKCEFYNRTYSSGKLTSEAIEVMELSGFVESSDELKKRCSGLCPYEISVNLAKRADVIIADYFHIFSAVRESFLSRINGKIENFIVIVDEAHNLPDRIRSNMSRKLTSNSLERAINEAKMFGFSDLVPVLRHIMKIFKQKGERRMLKEELIKHIENIGDVVDVAEEFVRVGEEVKKERKRSYLSSIGTFLIDWYNAGDEFAFIYRKSDKSELSLSCLDPSVISKPVLEGSYSTILMSGTLRPLEMYAKLLGSANAVMKSYPSPFPKSNRMDIVLTSVTSRYSKRNDDNLKRIAITIQHLMDLIKWSMAFFFPSYGFMRKIRSMLRDDSRVLMEQQGMTKEMKERFYRKFISSNKVLFGVSSGSFAEGVDYPGNKIKLVGIVGLPLANPDLETQSLIDYYELKFGSGWNYAYAYPAIIRTMQAAGRSIRSERDRGVIIYMDERFAWKNYRTLLPDKIEIVEKLPYDRIVDFLISNS